MYCGDRIVEVDAVRVDEMIETKMTCSEMR